jgi:toxoflavin synthase
MNTPVLYDDIGKNYVQKVSPTKEYTRIPTIFAMTGPIVGKDMLDLACGDGYQTRKFTPYHPRSLTGIDISPVMIEMARKHEQADPQGINFQVGDVMNLNLKEHFEIVSAIYLLDYTKTQKELLQMCQSIFLALKPGGIFSAITVKPSETPRDEFRYGWKVIHQLGKSYFYDGEEIHLVSDAIDSPSVTIVCYYWSKQTYESCLKQAGFKHISWYPTMEISDEGKKKYSADYWNEVRKWYGGIGIRAVKE